jgi:hypothetical protein
VGARDAAERVGAAEDRETEGEGDAGVVATAHDRGATAEEDQDEGADDLGGDLLGVGRGVSHVSHSKAAMGRFAAAEA